MSDEAVQVARLEEKFSAMKSDIERLEAQVVEMSGKLDTVLQALTEAKGGWKTLMAVGGAAAAMATASSWIINHVSVK